MSVGVVVLVGVMPPLSTTAGCAVGVGAGSPPGFDGETGVGVGLPPLGFDGVAVGTDGIVVGVGGAGVGVGQGTVPGTQGGCWALLSAQTVRPPLKFPTAITSIITPKIIRYFAINWLFMNYSFSNLCLCRNFHPNILAHF